MRKVFTIGSPGKLMFLGPCEAKYDEGTGVKLEESPRLERGEVALLLTSGLPGIPNVWGIYRLGEQVSTVDVVVFASHHSVDGLTPCDARIFEHAAREIRRVGLRVEPLSRRMGVEFTGDPDMILTEDWIAVYP